MASAVIARTPDRARHVLLTAVVASVAVVVLVGLGLTVPRSGMMAVAGGLAVLVLGATVYNPVAIPVLTMPALLVVERVGGGSANLSFSDFVLFAAFWVAVLLGSRPYSREFRAALWISAVYQLSTLFTVIANPYPQNTVEWFHAWLSVGGALVVGWAVGRAGRARTGLTLMTAGCVAIAFFAIVQALVNFAHGDTGPVFLAFPYDMSKNFIGNTVAFGALIAYARPRWLRWPRWWSYSAFWLCALGVAASQARQSLIGLGAGLIVVALRRGTGVKHSRWIFLALIPAGYFVARVVVEQLTSDNQFNSAFQRLTWYQQALSVWSEHQWFGVGLRWWVAGRTQYGFQPPNAELEVLSSAGTVGLVGFVILMAGSIALLWRLDPVYGTLGAAIVLLRLVQGQFDLFWVSVQESVPFAVAGVCFGALAYEQARRAGADARALSDAPPLAPRSVARPSPRPVEPVRTL